MDRDIIEFKLKEFVESVQIDDNIIGVFVHGSYLETEDFNDVDVVLVSKSGIDPGELMDIRIEYLKNFSDFFDIQIFQTLPTTVQKAVLKGRVLYETSDLYDVAHQTVKDYQHLKKYIEDYIEGTILED